MKTDLMPLATAERQDLATFLATLTPDEWEAETWCDDWRVRDVVAHMISYETLGPLGVLRRFARGGFRLQRANAIGIAEYADRSVDQLLDELTQCLVPRGITTGFGGMIALLDGMIHHQDIRRPLGRPRTIPPERLLAALDRAFDAPPLGAKQRARGLRLVADDHDWSSGAGPEVTGPAEAILLAIAGRRGVCAELSGPGLPILAERIPGAAIGSG